MFTSETIEHEDVAKSDCILAFFEPLMPISSALVMSSFRAKSISNLLGGDIVVIYSRGPIAKVKVGVLLNQGPSLEPKCKYVGGFGFIECIVHNMPSGDKGAWDVKHVKEFASRSL